MDKSISEMCPFHFHDRNTFLVRNKAQDGWWTSPSGGQNVSLQHLLSFQPNSPYSSGQYYKEQMCEGGVGKTENREVCCTERQNWRRDGGDWCCLLAKPCYWHWGTQPMTHCNEYVQAKLFQQKSRLGDTPWHTAASTVRFFFFNF